MSLRVGTQKRENISSTSQAESSNVQNVHRKSNTKIVYKKQDEVNLNSSEISSTEYLLARHRVTSEAHNAGRDEQDDNGDLRSEQRRTWRSLSEMEATRISIAASMVPDEILKRPSDYSVREFHAALMMIDVSGFTLLCETYTKSGEGGPSKLTQVLNSYIGSMVQEILTQNGDVYKFSGDAFLAIWKSSEKLSMQDVVHAAIDCALLIQKNYGSQMTDVGVLLRVKAAISAGRAYFSIIGDDTAAAYVLVGESVWDCKKAEKCCEAGDVVTSTSAWKYVNEAEYWTEHLQDGIHTRVMGVGVTWKTVGQALRFDENSTKFWNSTTAERATFHRDSWDESSQHSSARQRLSYQEYYLRPSVLNALHGSWWPSLRRFMLSPVLRAVDNDEPMDHLSEVRRVVVVFVNIVSARSSEVDLLQRTDVAYRSVYSIVSTSGGLLNKVNLFDKDLMFLAVFGLRGLKHEDEATRALRCAVTIRETLIVEKNFICVSVGVTSGSTYCGVVGHALRREYTVIGSSVNKAARLMTSYPHKVTCDTQTFLHSNLHPEFFRLQEAKPLKGIAKPGPVYEYLKNKSPMEWRNQQYHQLLGRANEIKLYEDTLMTAVKQNKQSDTTSGHQFGYVITGGSMVGKSRLMAECLNLTPDYVPVMKLKLFLEDEVEFGLVQKMFKKSLGLIDASRATVERSIRARIQMDCVSPLEVHAVNVIFDCRFPLPERFLYYGDLLLEYRVKRLIRQMCISCFPTFVLCAIEGGRHIDHSSWRTLSLIMEADAVFFLINVASELFSLSKAVRNTLRSDKFVKVDLCCIDRLYHAALACQVLSVKAIPAELEKVIQCFSGGNPGWIQNYVVTLKQSGWVKVESTTRNKALASGAVLPSREFLDLKAGPSKTSFGHGWDLFRTSYKESLERLQDLKEDTIQVAVLDEGYNCELDVGGQVNALILKTYDSLTPFEKMLVKCGSVLGDVFTRRMIEQLLSCSTNALAKAVQKLFEVDVLVCEGGDFTEPCLVLVHLAPAPSQQSKGPYCFCRQVEPLSNELHLPAYAFCGYMRFKNPVFRSTTYDLLTENQKLEFHSRALMFLEKHIQRCEACSGGCFTRIAGERADNDFVVASSRVKAAKEKMTHLCTDAMNLRDPHYNAVLLHHRNVSEEFQVFSHKPYQIAAEEIALPHTAAPDLENGLQQDDALLVDRTNIIHARFPSMDMSHCKCLEILNAVYPVLIRHCRGTEQWNKLVESYLEYAFIHILSSKIPQALQLLLQVENFVLHNSEFTKHEKWHKKVIEARIMSHRGACMLDLRDFVAAESCLLRAMKLYGCRFPKSLHLVRLYNVHESMKQTMILSLPTLMMGTQSGRSSEYYEELATTLNYLHRLFMEKNDLQKAELAAKWSLNLALRTNTNFRLLCESFANTIDVSRLNRNVARCSELERLSNLICRKRRLRLEVTELRALTSLYTAIFRFYVTTGRIHESIDFGLSVLHLMTDLTDPIVQHTMLLELGNLLLADLRIAEAATVMQRFLLSSHSDAISETWYSYMVMKILLRTGYSVKSFRACEKFYLQSGDEYLKSKSPEAAVNFIALMWLMCIRCSWWEHAAIWEQRMKKLKWSKIRQERFGVMHAITLLEGRLVQLVEQMNNCNTKAANETEAAIDELFTQAKSNNLNPAGCKPMIDLLKAYRYCIHGRRRLALYWLERSHRAAQAIGDEPLLAWTEHTRQHWLGTLESGRLRHWLDHSEPPNHRTIEQFRQDPTIIPYTLPLPNGVCYWHDIPIQG